MKRKLILLSIAVLLLIVSIKFFPYHCNCLAPGAGQNGAVIDIGNSRIKALVANTPDLRERGLSGRTGLPSDSGMLFVFDTPSRYGFWMKDMEFPIDIIWISGDRVVGIEKSLSPDSYPQIFYPEEDVNFVLEVPAGFSERHNINIADSFSVSF
jgi:uncharacterized membrane protein (UPF0127 family)